MPAEHLGLCRTLLDDGETRCSVPVKPGRQSCPRHTSAYDASYKRYKDAENAAKDLRAAAQTKRGDVHTIPPEDVEPRIKRVSAYIKALESELQLRNEHDQRFIGNPDKGHLQRLDALEKQLTHHRDIVETLRARLRIQRLKPAGQPTPPKHRRRHRHTVSDPTPQPPAPSASRSFRRRSHGQPSQRRGGHGKSHSVQTGSVQGRKEHPIVLTGEGEGLVEEDDGLGHPIRPSALSFHVLEDSWVGGASGQGVEAEYQGGGVAERYEDEGCQEEPTQCEEDRPILTASCLPVGATNASPPSPSRREPTNEDGSSLQECSENGDTSTRCPVPPSPLPWIVGEYPGANPEHVEEGNEAQLGAAHRGGYLKYAFAAILPATMIVLIRMFTTIRGRTSRI
ncbi:hypothetical protein GSI_14522 [Ganoderma sinense ZZ0214-1]|uniref:Uncharacterized protein n=1 Tax=Ganoderma sinense ZZ0214-1 TaxID=1077348 RepID=A0A2G8RNZ4_9APHY|nr:hypothetical protein GSI_14522 [Ganoderma sinense ZZ0214-1]